MKIRRLNSVHCAMLPVTMAIGIWVASCDGGARSRDSEMNAQSAAETLDARSQANSFPMSVPEYNITMEEAKEALQPFTPVLQKLFSNYYQRGLRAGKNISFHIFSNMSSDAMFDFPMSRMTETEFVIHVTTELLRAKGFTDDIFSVMICHELGHLLGGFPLHPRSQEKVFAAAEGQADYFATLQCTRTLWKDELAKNQRALEFAKKNNPRIVSRCREAWQGTAEQNVCIRSILASEAKINFTINYPSKKEEHASTATSEGTVVDQTNDFTYPSKQCRLDTLVSGALCPITFDLSFIPKTVTQSLRSACQQGNYPKGARRLCWFKPE